MARIILHIDMDAFFASVEQIDNPSLKGKPVIIGADPKQGRGRGVVSTCSYEARRFGVHSAMPISRAWELCPAGIYLPPRMRRYCEVSNRVFSILDQYSPLVEPVSIDEAFLDCTGTERLFGPAETVAERIRNAVKAETGLTASIGIASNKSVAKIASDMNKPDGVTICPPGEEEKFLRPLPVGRLWGAGKKTVERLEQFNIRTIGDLAATELSLLKNITGDASGEHLWNLARGIDARPVIPNGYERKSISEEKTFERDTDDAVLIARTVLEMADGISRNMRSEGIAGRTVTVKLRLTGFETFTRNTSFDCSFSDMMTIRDAAMSIITSFDRQGKQIRLIGVGVTNLKQSALIEEQIDLFTRKSDKEKKREDLLDELKARYGKKVTRGSLLDCTDDDEDQ
jgi:nucleotidyltransferase/DNA polymerase involved in DNA repair